MSAPAVPAEPLHVRAWLLKSMAALVYVALTGASRPCSEVPCMHCSPAGQSRTGGRRSGAFAGPSEPMIFGMSAGSGESSGTLEIMLDRVATYKEKTEALKAKIKKALTYPIAVIVVAVVVTGILLVKVVPQFAETFQSFGSDLPGFTLFVLGVSEWVQSWWFTLLLGFFVLGYLVSQAKRRSKEFADWLDALALKVHIIGGVVHDAVLRTIGFTLA